jgi:hypothetical protein
MLRISLSISAPSPGFIRPYISGCNRALTKPRKYASAGGKGCIRPSILPSTYTIRWVTKLIRIIAQGSAELASKLFRYMYRYKYSSTFQSAPKKYSSFKSSTDLVPSKRTHQNEALRYNERFRTRYPFQLLLTLWWLSEILSFRNWKRAAIASITISFKKLFNPNWRKQSLVTSKTLTVLIIVRPSSLFVKMERLILCRTSH